MSPPCPLCAGAVGGDGAMVCGGCLRRHAGGGPVRATGEFVVPSIPSELAEAAPPPAAPGTCSWCGKPAAEVRKLLGNGAVSICDGCVGLCAEILDAELGPGWR